MVDVHADMQCLTLIRAQIAVVAVVASPDVDEPQRFFKPRSGLLRADAQCGVLQGESYILARHALEVPRARITHRNQIEHVPDDIEPDTHSIDDTGLVEALLATHVATQGERLSVHLQSAGEAMENATGDDALEDLGAGVFNHQLYVSSVTKLKDQRIAPVEFHGREGVFGGQVERFTTA